MRRGLAFIFAVFCLFCGHSARAATDRVQAVAEDGTLTLASGGKARFAGLMLPDASAAERHHLSP